MFIWFSNLILLLQSDFCVRVCLIPQHWSIMKRRKCFSGEILIERILDLMLYIKVNRICNLFASHLINECIRDPDHTSSTHPTHTTLFGWKLLLTMMSLWHHFILFPLNIAPCPGMYMTWQWSLEAVPTHNSMDKSPTLPLDIIPWSLDEMADYTRYCTCMSQ